MKHLFLLLILSFNLLAVQGNSFVVSGAAEVTPGKADETLDNPEVQTKLIAQLKQKAVAEWLQNYDTIKPTLSSQSRSQKIPLNTSWKDKGKRND